MDIAGDSRKNEPAQPEIMELLEIIHSRHPEEVLDLPDSGDEAGASAKVPTDTEDDPAAVYDLGVLNASPPQ